MTSASGREIALNRREFSRAEVEERLMKAFKGRKGRVTLSELVQYTGLPALTLEPVLRDVVVHWDVSIDVLPGGEIAWNVGDGLKTRVDSDELRRLKRQRQLMAIFQAIFKVGIVVALVGFFVVFVALMIAALVVVAGGKSNDSRSSRNSRGGSVVILPRGGVGRVFSRGSGGGIPVNTRFAGAATTDQRSFIDKVFSFVFGPKEEDVDELFTEQQLVAWIAASKGVITPMELSARTGWSPRASESESSRLLAQYDGNVEILPDGSTLFAFDEQTKTAAGAAKPIGYFWDAFEREESTTGNTSGFNLLMVFMNGFILFASVYLMPTMISPALGLQEILDPAVYWGGLIILPALYAVTFFAVPLLRMNGPVKRENEARKERNLRRVLLREIYGHVLNGRSIIDREQVIDAADRARPDGAIFPFPPLPELNRVFDAIAFEWGVEAQLVNGRKVYDFRVIRDQFEAARTFRKRGGSLQQNRLKDQFAAFDQAVMSGQSLMDHDFAGAAMSSPERNFTPAVAPSHEPVLDTIPDNRSRRNQEF